MTIRRFRTVVPARGRTGPQPVWRVGTVLKVCLGLSRPERARLWREGSVAVNGAPVPAQQIHCYPGDVVEAWYPEPASSVQPQPELPLGVLYEDGWLLAIDKPAGQLSHPARSEQRGTVANAVAGRLTTPHPLTPSPLEGEGAPIRLVHRLDRDTSGGLLIARDAATARALARQRAAGQLERTYLALVAGHPPREGEIDLPLAPDPSHRTRRVADPENRTGRAATARTSYVAVFRYLAATLVAARLHSGRTHQLRAHFTAMGHPLLADDLYGGPPAPGIARQALHAWRTTLRHPATGEWLTIAAPVPADFVAAGRELLGETGTI